LLSSGPGLFFLTPVEDPLLAVGLVNAIQGALDAAVLDAQAERCSG
jgi:hypothetical protein